MTQRTTLRRLIGVYDANGTVTGELAYLFRRGVAGEHCALCDITHGRLRERRDWRDERTRLSVPFVTYHRNDQPAAVRMVTGGRAPVVVAEYENGHIVVLLDDDELLGFDGSPRLLVDRLLAISGGEEPG